MAHLQPEMFVDLLDGTLPESAVPHLAACDACREQLATLRSTWEATVQVEVPEPSPLFWEHLSARVHDAVAAEDPPPVRWWRIDWAWRGLGLAAVALASVVFVIVLKVPDRRASPAPAPVASVQRAVDEGARVEPLPALPDDESIGFVADLASGMDLDTALPELGLTTHGAADRALADLTGDERIELHRLLDEAIGSNQVM